MPYPLRYRRACRITSYNVCYTKLLRQKDGELTEDEHKRHTKSVQDLTDSFIGKLEEILKAKEAELMEV